MAFSFLTSSGVFLRSLAAFNISASQVSTSPYSCAMILAVASPISGMPMALIRRSSEMVRRSLIALMRLLTDSSPQPSRFLISSALLGRRKMSPGIFSSPSLKKFSMCVPPSPSMSKQLRDTK